MLKNLTKILYPDTGADDDFQNLISFLLYAGEIFMKIP